MLLNIPPGMQRVFIGVPVDQYSQQNINELLGPIKKTRQDIRWVPENNRHLTLAFLGNIPVATVQKLLRTFAEAYQQETHFQYQLSTLTRFPEATGRIIALTGQVTSPLDHLFQITREFIRIASLEMVRKSFKPHITLARIRNAKHVKTTFVQQVNINLDITKITFYQSTLTDSGSIYASLKEIQLD